MAKKAKYGGNLRRDTESRGSKLTKSLLARGRVTGVPTSRSSRIAKVRGSSSRRAMRRGRQPNLRRLSRELADLPRFSSFIQRREQQLQGRLRTIPGSIARTVYSGSGIPELKGMYDQIAGWYQFFAGLDESWFGKRDREDREEDDEDQEEETEPEVIIIYRDREEQESTTEVGGTFGVHQKILFGHLDKIISLLKDVTAKPYRKDTIATTRTPFFGNRNNRDDEDDAQPMLATLLAGLTGALIGGLSSGNLGGGLLSGLTRLGQVAVGALAGNAFGRLLRDGVRERASDRRQQRRQQQRQNRNARNIRAQVSGGRTRGARPQNRVRGLMRQVRRAGATISRTVGGMGRGTVALLRTLRRIARIGGVAGAIAIPILEWFERSEQMRELQQNPNLTDREREVAEAQIWVEGIADVLAVSGGAAIGGLAVLIPFIGPFVGLITSGIGAWLGQMGADWFNRNYADDVARFLVDSNATNAIQSFVDGIVNLPSTFLRLLETGIRTNPILFAPLLPLLPMIREQRERAQQRRVRLPPEPPEATPTPPQPAPATVPESVEEEPPQLEVLPEGQRTLTGGERALRDAHLEVEPEEHDHTHEISAPTRRDNQVIVVREIHTLIYKSNKLAVAR